MCSAIEYSAVYPGEPLGGKHCILDIVNSVILTCIIM